MARVPLLWLSVLRLLVALAAGSASVGAVVAVAPTAAERVGGDAASERRAGIVTAGTPDAPDAIWDRAPGQLGAILRTGGLERDGGARTLPPSIGGPAHADVAALPVPRAARETRRARQLVATLPTRYVAATRLGALHYYPTAPPSGS